MTTASLAVIFTVVALPSAAQADTCGGYYFKYFPTSGSISTWCDNADSWGVNAPDGTGYVAQVYGEDWGTWSPGTVLPKRLNAIPSTATTWFSQSSSPASDAGFNSTYDIFIDPQAAPQGRNSLNEIMIWLSYSRNKPLSDNWDSAGNPVPWATNVGLGGRQWDVYLYHWPNGGLTMSYLDRANSGWWSGSLSPFFNHGIANGWYSGNDYLNSIQAGWEFGHGNYSASSWGVAGF
ncbi:hypothetical protein K3N28_15625 [Glycomyces sp. TRM65418]|uniref:GH12 family glycosyl hydrolase domain-containing protein n=1 Tax=Glycomyces sp. TRM65418 TaxID=2867006 RepID=UPI001CE5827B|nr:hypothetical protein [Glycomyces sp. TRM65418]MCC3764493.1 hypothetical protein [Glycomyces sp. TRM65418]QZD54164.1 hypothetical protein K3N28_15545 [Glycomyces sp. TRM65418]